MICVDSECIIGHFAVIIRHYLPAELFTPKHIIKNTVEHFLLLFHYWHTCILLTDGTHTLYDVMLISVKRH